MQTFLPHPGFVASARVLDDRRLGKQRVETFQVLRALTWPDYGWKNHPVSRMWRGFVPALVCYGLACIEAWERRGRVDATRGLLLEFTGGRVPEWGELRDTGQLPPWLGDEAVHRSHRSRLVAKEPESYAAVFPGEAPDLDYVWPGASVPRWPLPVGQGLAVAQAAAELGLAEVDDEQLAAVLDLQEGGDAVVHLPHDAGPASTGLLAALCTSGSTAWVTPGTPPPAHPGEPEEPRPTVEASKLAASIARPPSPEAAAAVRAQAAAQQDPRLAWVRPSQLATLAGLRPDLALVVLEGTEEQEEQLPRPELGVPVLRLVRSG
ncbi:hypothetical protein EV189_1785 [Motilibacter rhizosphaerae]|uniref:Uncharacterized protein n=1 Tax=Motilibacter rhizosphaerae TaxID=598652 RepID=A0A4Q7NSA1_9ACTN|nr:MSMEG_6728 family protein [Motilibacter rhizosphaerae]RZS90003.1 hypothetical protein EV189_1785 [Motilibacter rhizosphaerae]